MLVKAQITSEESLEIKMITFVFQCGACIVITKKLKRKEKKWSTNWLTKSEELKQHLSGALLKFKISI